MSNLIHKQTKLYYGWWIVGAATIITFYAGGVVYYGFTAFFEPLAKTFGWSYTQISLAASLRGMETAFAAPLMGVLVDRLGPRKLMAAGAFAVGLSFMLLSLTTSLWMFYGAFVLLGTGISCCIGTVPMTAIANWFRQRIGVASGIVYCGFSFSGLIVLAIVKLIDLFDWRTTAVILGIGMWVIVIPLALLIRHKPEQNMPITDGNSTLLEKDADIHPAAETNTTLKDALKSATFWHIAVALTLQLLVLNAVVTHIMPYLNSAGISRTTASLVAFAVPLITIIGRAGSGWLGDRFNKRYVTALGLGLTSLGLIFFSFISPGQLWIAIPFLLFYSIGHGTQNTMAAAMIREFFGTKKFGAIHGFLTGIMAMGGMSGPLIVGWTFDTRGTYHPVWLGFACLIVVALVIVATTPPYKRSSNR